MMQALRPYPEYRDSGVSWLEAVPSHWSVFPNRNLFVEIKDRGHPAEELLSVTIGSGVLRQERLLAQTSKKDGSNIDRAVYKLALPGDIVYNKMRAWQGAIGISNYKGLVSPAYVVLRLCADGDPGYFHHLFRIPAFAKEAERWSYGITSDQWSLRPEHFRMIYCSLPPRREQSAIVRYLNHIDRRIRQYIRAKKKVVALLREQKQAFIHRAVTRGLDSTVRLKPSGLEWLGDVPERWEVRRLKEVTTPIEQGWSPQCEAQPASADDWGVLKVGCVNSDYFDSRQNKKLPASLEPVPDLEVHDGDILVSRANTRELLGLAALVTESRARLMLCDKLFRFRSLPDRVDSRFLVYGIRARSSRAQIESSTNGASDSMQNIGQGVVRNLLLAIPPMVEQKRIVSFLESQRQSLEVAVSKAEREISLLQEYRARLIADVVTGKLDVREAAANLPDEPAEPEPFEDTEEPSEEEDIESAEQVEEPGA